MNHIIILFFESLLHLVLTFITISLKFTIEYHILLISDPHPLLYTPKFFLYKFNSLHMNNHFPNTFTKLYLINLFLSLSQFTIKLNQIQLFIFKYFLYVVQVQCLILDVWWFRTYYLICLG